jgi:oligoendopeptidase F
MSTLAISALTPAAFAQATWDDIAPLYQELNDRALSVDTVRPWLADWSRLEAVLGEAAALAMIAYTCDTADPAKEAAHLRFSGEILPRMDEQSVKLANRLLALGYTEPDLEVVIAKFRTASEIFREENVRLMSEVEEHCAHYQKITGGFTVLWEGQEKTIPQLQPYLQSPDRGVRERAWRLGNEPYLARRDELADIFDRLFELRQRMAHNADFADYEAYAFKAKCRFDYTPDDCRRFHDAVEAVVVPAVERLFRRRRERLRVPSLRPWDLGPDPDGRPPLRPFQQESELVEAGTRLFEQVSPQFGRHFRLMAGEKLLDLASRKGKAPGGYCETLHYRGKPFIFMNAVGVWEDVSTLLHEAGHAFHAFEAHHYPLIWQRHPGLEACELASMSMELLAAPYLARERGGFFTPGELARARTEHLEDILLTLTHVASVDAFQSWLYRSGRGSDRDARDAAWLAVRGRFERGIDWSVLERERTARWYRQLHIFLYPFYYIEYGLAQVGALQIWRNSLRDPASAVERYRSALALGNTRSLPALFRAAGAEFTFDAPVLAELVALVEQELDRWQDVRAA